MDVDGQLGVREICARLAQSVERETLNLNVVGSSMNHPTMTRILLQSRKQNGSLRLNNSGTMTPHVGRFFFHFSLFVILFRRIANCSIAFSFSALARWNSLKRMSFQRWSLANPMPSVEMLSSVHCRE